MRKLTQLLLTVSVAGALALGSSAALAGAHHFGGGYGYGYSQDYAPGYGHGHGRGYGRDHGYYQMRGDWHDGRAWSDGYRYHRGGYDGPARPYRHHAERPWCPRW